MKEQKISSSRSRREEDVFFFMRCRRLSRIARQQNYSNGDRKHFQSSEEKGGHRIISRWVRKFLTIFRILGSFRVFGKSLIVRHFSIVSLVSFII
mmetsp:Transcript_31350/g.35665  ORF Transcript_31350/g.35665 Transcript_31350/m.35665 type:complete len:95 (+) Transcript_31350:664-948(+)